MLLLGRDTTVAARTPSWTSVLLRNSLAHQEYKGQEELALTMLDTFYSWMRSEQDLGAHLEHVASILKTLRTKVARQQGEQKQRAETDDIGTALKKHGMEALKTPTHSTSLDMRPGGTNSNRCRQCQKPEVGGPHLVEHKALTGAALTTL